MISPSQPLIPTVCTAVADSSEHAAMASTRTQPIRYALERAEENQTLTAVHNDGSAHCSDPLCRRRLSSRCPCIG